ncbi:hypothetical protein [Halobaculum marinum]|uniref:Outer membrane lipoprotein-sorting protein n=1 Tax=Halobaculum marinum TaxID=3031996 RepID=A0ABD5WVL6_9EURY|nr:hypothetical protein [Halobaculum sp. DT55]
MSRGGSARSSRRYGAVALVVLVVLAGCTSFGVGGGDGGARTVNPALAETPTATATPTGGFPAGVSPAGVDVEAMIDAHRAALANGSWTVSLNRTVVGLDGEVERSSARVLVDGNRSLYTFERVRGDNRLANAHWRNGTAAASKRVSWRGDVTLDGRPRDAGGPAGLDPTGGAWLYAASVDTRPSYAGVEVTPNGTVTLIEAAEGRIERSGLPDRRQVRLSARVDERGVVRSLSLRYEVFLGNEPGSVTLSLRTTNVGSTTVPRPEWVDRALANATVDDPGDGSTPGAADDD